MEPAATLASIMYESLAWCARRGAFELRDSVNKRRIQLFHGGCCNGGSIALIGSCQQRWFAQLPHQAPVDKSWSAEPK